MLENKILKKQTKKHKILMCENQELKNTKFQHSKKC